VGWGSCERRLPGDGHTSPPAKQVNPIIADGRLEVCDGMHSAFVMKQKADSEFSSADEITVSAPHGRVDLVALKRPRLGGKEPTRLSHQPRSSNATAHSPYDAGGLVDGRNPTPLSGPLKRK